MESARHHREIGNNRRQPEHRCQGRTIQHREIPEHIHQHCGYFAEQDEQLEPPEFGAGGAAAKIRVVGKSRLDRLLEIHRSTSPGSGKGSSSAALKWGIT
jgi:hypothetical protein